MKPEDRFYYALKRLIHNSVDSIGNPKAPTINQLNKAIDVINWYEKYFKFKAKGE